MNKCSFGGCNMKVHARGLCGSHYQQTMRGETLTSLRHRPNVREWLLSHVDYSGGDCLIWPFARAKTGYAQVRGGWASRVMCELAHGEAPPRYEAAHSCGRGHLGCVNPRHLRWATSKENKADMIVHGTRPAKLSAEQVRTIRSGAVPLADLAHWFGVSLNHIYAVAGGKHWEHV